MNTQIQITGYEQGGHCEHCGRSLKHCIVTTEGVFGATCFDRVLTKPRIYQGKPYRIGEKQIVYMAKVASRYNLQGMRRFGLDAHNLTFEKV